MTPAPPIDLDCCRGLGGIVRHARKGNGRTLPRAGSTTSTHRFLVCGDSHIFGWGLPRERRCTDLLEDQCSGLEVLNLVVPGYGLDQQLLALTASR